MQHLLKEGLEAARDWTIEIRRELHKIPELALEEEKTAALVAKTLTELGFEPQTGIGKHGVVATLDTGRPGPVVMFRADMDALPIQEESGLPFASTHEGVAHCCGHDCHTAMLLGTAKVLSEAKDKLSGIIRFVFQPAEEAVSGAQPMIAEGIMDSPKVDYCFGMHVWPTVPKGQVGIKDGKLMAAMSWFDLEILGKGGHGAMPHQCVDALEVGTQVVSALQRVTSRQMNPLQPTVVTVGQFYAGTAMNIIPGRAELHGTTRTFDKDVWRTWDERLRTIIAGVCSSMGADFTFEFHQGVPPVSNDPDATNIARKAAIKLVGEDNVMEPEPTMGGEDMSLFLEQAKGAFVFLGAQVENGYPLHNPKIVFPEDILATGVALNCQIACDLLT
ncbi:M20 metallopeptidase family protein [Desulfovibrio ferrophilus]|uniref:Putative Thermostable carboxypeptidase 1 n=1 Tax=Desulfovibrio ferrophilus TaxID=241368 RepID=A0A2Z6B306_9BACT|nr:M20 family metallopeptidase [Desulfovibrio ferrophilus]BBD09887.1 putative Thermostable carboxypeptidase 1 [Desulfovibrio ferrophilus]